MYYKLTLDEDENTVPCGLCGSPTNMTDTKRCDRCWEWEGRIRRDPELAAKILAAVGRVVIDERPEADWPSSELQPEGSAV
jgi:hypothetical protein